MVDRDSEKSNKILTGEELKLAGSDEDSKIVRGVTRRNFLLYTVGAVAGGLFLSTINTGCGGGGGGGPTSSFPVLVFSDVHFNPFYDPTLFTALNTTDISGWPAIFQGSQVTTPSLWGANGATQFDTNYPLLALTLSAVRQNLGASPFVIYTGDILGHNFETIFYQLYGSQDVAAAQAFANNTVAFFMEQVRSAVGNLPVLFALGNADSYGGVGAESAFLSSTAQLFYSQFLNGIVDQQTFLTTFTSGGYYSAEIPSLNLVVIGLNSFEYSSADTNTSPGGLTAQLTWLNTTLASAQASGKKVWLLMHMPTGANASGCTFSGSQVTTAAMFWNEDPSYQASCLQILSQYPGLITFTLGAHTHLDEYRIVQPGQVLDIAGGISPLFGNNPAFKVFTISGDTLMATDYISLNCDLSTTPAQFASYYTFSKAYGMQGYLNDSLTQLFPQFKTNSAKQAFYRGSYFSGHVPSTAVENPPITDATWPAYWSSIGNMDEQDFINGVNSY